ncbi:MAG TPA: thioesterase family protein, partial [Longimicrobiaceae bacterium]|nr:thioesterase family protein [Longimicrobiaceae bacterium]
LLRVLLGVRFRPRLGPLDESVLHFRVMPHDLDPNLHMNNARYLGIMDLGRTDLVLRMGVVRELFRRRWNPVVGHLTIRYRRSLAPFQRYSLHTRLVCWDEKAFYLEQRFEHRGHLMARAVVRGVFLGPEGTVPATELVRMYGAEQPSPPMPEGIRAWVQGEGLM